MAAAQVTALPDRIKDYRGHVFHRWTVLEFVDRHKRRTRWLCRCECGTMRAVRITDLQRGHAKSCGCLTRERTIARNTTHGLSGTPEYEAWANMVNRCTNPDHAGWEHYGGRGITVCDRWLGPTGLANFIADMGDRPSSAHSLERDDNDCGYAPENCRWATKKEQMSNTRHCHFVTFRNETRTVTDWANHLGMNPVTLSARLRNRNLTLEQAMTLPVERGAFIRRTARSLDGRQCQFLTPTGVQPRCSASQGE